MCYYENMIFVMFFIPFILKFFDYSFFFYIFTSTFDFR